MWSIANILEIIFPERLDHKLIKKLSPQEFQKYYQPTTQSDWTNLASFEEPIVRAAIHEAKFHHSDQAFTLLASLLLNYLQGLQHPAILLPIPLSKQRERKRGYNQVSEIARVALKTQNLVTLGDNILFKIKDNKPQTSLSRKQRLENTKDAYAVKPEEASRLSGQHIILLDDVVTTGATLQAAKATLLPYRPASITLLALAH